MKWLIALFSVASAFAAPSNAKNIDPKCIQKKDHILTGYFGGQVNYSWLDLTLPTTYNDWIFGANFGVHYRAHHFIFMGDFIWNQGNFKNNDRKHWLQDAFGTLSVGYLFFWRNMMVGPFVGLGLRRWTDKRDEYMCDASTLCSPLIELKYVNYFIPFGLMAYWHVNCAFRFGLVATMMPSFDSTVEINGLNGTKWILGRKTSYSVEVPFVWRLVQSDKWKDVELVLAPFWRWLKTGKSTVLDLRDRDQTYVGLILRIQKRTR